MSYQPIIGEIMMYAGTFIPRGWARCDGNLLLIADYNALYSLIGTTYGGDGSTTFALPDFRGRAPIHVGQGPGLSQHERGEKGGTENITLSNEQMPPHEHGLPITTDHANTNNPENAMLAATNDNIYGVNIDPVTLDPRTVQSYGNNQSINRMPPMLGMNFIIAIEGTYPQRD